MDGVVKVVVGLVLVVVSLGLVAGLTVAVHHLLNQQGVTWWAIALGIPGLILTLVGFVLIAIGTFKVFSGRGRG